ncbi:MAG: peptidase U34 [Pseudonocardiaceae bacterium]|nr:peptidase U34 [Pseudonocardiaceae bacterium]
MRRTRARRTATITTVAVGLLLAAPPASTAQHTSPARKPPAPHAASPGDKSFAVYIGKNLTENKHPFLGGFGHEPSSHWIDIVPRRTYQRGTTMRVGATGEADIPGQLTRIPQASNTARYITSNYSEFAGFPAPLTNGGLNEHGVAARDVWSDSRQELVDQTPTPQRGPTYSDLSRIAMERAHSAREAVRILGDLVNKYGYTTYGGNSHMFADANEGWVFIEFAGGERLWAAERLGPDDVRVSYPGYIGDFPANWRNNPDYMASPNLVDYAVRRGWWRSNSGKPFNLRDAYGTPFPGQPVEIGEKADPKDEGPYRHPPSLEAEFRKLNPVKLQDVMRIVRDPRWADDRSGYGHVAELDDSLPDPAMAKLWVATTSAITAPYIPVYIGTRTAPPEYRQHRYLTHDSASEFLDPEFAEQESTEYATQTYKQLLYSTCARPEKYLDGVTSALEGFEAEIIDGIQDSESEAGEKFRSGSKRDAQIVLTDVTSEWSLKGLDLANYLLDDQRERTRADGGVHIPRVPVPEGATANTQSMDMSLRSEESARDRVNCDVGGGWSDGGTLARKGTYGDPEDVPDYAQGAAGEDSESWWLFGITGVGGILVGAGAMWFATRRSR